MANDEERGQWPATMCSTFPAGKGVRQGCILSPYLFNLYAEHIRWKARLDSEAGRVKTGRRNIHNLREPDDNILVVESSNDLK